jgi:hypothetical protein
MLGKVGEIRKMPKVKSWHLACQRDFTVETLKAPRNTFAKMIAI